MHHEIHEKCAVEMEDGEDPCGCSGDDNVNSLFCMGESDSRVEMRPQIGFDTYRG